MLLTPLSLPLHQEKMISPGNVLTRMIDALELATLSASNDELPGMLLAAETMLKELKCLKMELLTAPQLQRF
jgi:hypothetical protein